MAIASSSQKAHVAALDTQPFKVDALHRLSLKYDDISNNNSKLEDYSIQV
jgi:hypothetical protein